MIDTKKPDETQLPISRVDEIPPGESVSAIVYGASKTGKTWFFGTAGDRALIIDTGAGLETLRSPAFRIGIGTKPFIVSVKEKLGERGWVDEAEAFDMVCDGIDQGLARFGDEIDTVIVDDMTALQRYAMNKALEVNAEKKKSKSLERSKKLDALVLAQQDWGIQMDLVTRMLASYVETMKSIKKNFIVGAHERCLYRPLRRDDGGIAGEELYKIIPAFYGKQYLDTICGLFDEIWHTETANTGAGTSYRIRLTGDAPSDVQGAVQLVAGTRHAGVFKESVIVKPNFLKMLEEIKNSYSITNLPTRGAKK
jgi:hypothetical protein